MSNVTRPGLDDGRRQILLGIGAGLLGAGLGGELSGTVAHASPAFADKKVPKEAQALFAGLPVEARSLLSAIGSIPYDMGYFVVNPWLDASKVEKLEPKSGHRFEFTDPAGKNPVSLDLPPRFQPYQGLSTAEANYPYRFNTRALPSGSGLDAYRDFQAVLNIGRPDGLRLAGNYYNLNAFSNDVYPPYTATDELGHSQWQALLGYHLRVPEVGELKGEEGHMVMAIMFNINKRVHRFGPSNPLYSEAGFLAVGRLYDLRPNTYPELEHNMTAHWLAVARQGAKDENWKGLTDVFENASRATVVVVGREQWGWDDPIAKTGPRGFFRLIRAQEVQLK